MEDVKETTPEVDKSTQAVTKDGTKKVDPERHKEFIEGVIPKHMIRSMRDLIMIMANRAQQRNPSLDINDILNRCQMTQGD